MNHEMNSNVPNKLGQPHKRDIFVLVIYVADQIDKMITYVPVAGKQC
jgi:hypothetical protein